MRQNPGLSWPATDGHRTSITATPSSAELRARYRLPSEENVVTIDRAQLERDTTYLLEPSERTPIEFDERREVVVEAYVRSEALHEQAQALGTPELVQEAQELEDKIAQILEADPDLKWSEPKELTSDYIRGQLGVGAGEHLAQDVDGEIRYDLQSAAERLQGATDRLRGVVDGIRAEREDEGYRPSIEPAQERNQSYER